MTVKAHSLWRIIAPGLVFQGVIIGGGYATGRELVEFFLSHGALGALYALALTGAIWSIVLAVAFEYARLTRSFDYDSLLVGLLGRARFLFEIVYLSLIILVISVITSAADEIAATRLNAPHGAGVGALALAVSIGVFMPEKIILRGMAYWSILLYAAYGALFALGFASFSGDIAAQIADGMAAPGWPHGAVAYAGYSLAGIPAVLFTLKTLNDRSEALAAGAIAGVVAIMPAVLFALILFAFLPDILSASVPLTVVLNALPATPLAPILDIVIFGTLIQTGVGGVNAVNQRIAASATKRGWKLPFWFKPFISLLIFGVSLLLAVKFGIIEIVAKGYGALTYAFLALLVAPIMTLGLWRCLRSEQ